jgi:hypothetical protein
MKTILSSLLLLVLISCQTNDKKISATADNGKAWTDSTNLTEIQWLDTNKQFGKINEGQKLEVVFRFKNIGSKPLVIENVQPGCGCTVAEKPGAPVMPGEEGMIKASFDSNGKSGNVKKNMTVTANTEPRTSIVYFEGEVIPKTPTGAEKPQAVSH